MPEAPAGPSIFDGKAENAAGAVRRKSETAQGSHSDAVSLPEPASRSKTLYSAARACNELGFAAETMKSWIRGMISDLKREPLNTP